MDGVASSKTFERICEALQLSVPDFLSRPLSGYGNMKRDRLFGLFCALQLVGQPRYVHVRTVELAVAIFFFIVSSRPSA